MLRFIYKKILHFSLGNEKGRRERGKNGIDGRERE